MELLSEAATDRGWRYEAQRRVNIEGLTPQKAMDSVALRYLLLGDARALLDGILRLYWRPGDRLLTYVSAMMLPQQQRHFHPSDLPFHLSIDFIRHRGRPLQEKTKGRVAEQERQTRYLARVHQSAVQMAIGRLPPRWFWEWLAAELEPSSASDGYKSEVPLRATLAPLIARQGRRIDPELTARNELLGEMVADRLDQLPIKAAVHEVLEKVNVQAGSEDAIIKLDHETIRKAYILKYRPK